MQEGVPNELPLINSAPRQLPPGNGLALMATSMSVLTFSVLGYLALKVLEPSSPAAANTLYKLGLYRKYFMYFLLSKDKSYKLVPPASVKNEARRKTVVFMRHGESEWNLVFNKGFGPSFLVRLFSAIFREIALLPTRDSIFIDSSLSREGLAQVHAAHKFIASSSAPALLKENESSVLVTSNLRRAIETGTLAFQNRLSLTGERLLVLSSLQEISRNVDANALAEPHSLPDLHVVSRNITWKEFDSSEVYDVKNNLGNKTLKSNGRIRMADFCDWAMHRQTASTVIVAAGHSLWFRDFFREYLPAQAEHIGKLKKMVNCGIVRFDLVEDEDGIFTIDPETVQSIYGGFEGEKKGA
eukprot:Plantae.Rhodophyta-Purpureofilum_apyrenoidigerum.ctg5323.p1 GENE.Plantae.Rhodophyta-Purpureofilum_apyrenoidigerum.ctg5323~~Plantae.Rhodophyta-Purpureofilum_apyrenoidigerum.ctg5323.p1  ORF type:complete len:356 (+),score=76.24 Plantae.Rhodophyta-Purpureofilum_apyrenoidigerum.ctg5323:1571-2638(+)